MSFFSNLAEQFKAIPQLVKQTWKTAEAKATEQRLARELETRTTPEIATPAIPTPIKPAVGLDFFANLSTKLKEVIPEPKLPEPIVKKEEIERLVKPIEEAIFPKPVERTGKMFQDTSNALKAAFETPTVKALMEPMIAISKAVGGALAGTLDPRGKTLKEWYREQPMAFEEIQRRLEETSIGKKLPVLPIAAGLVAEMLLPPYFGKSEKFFDEIAKTVDKGTIKNLLMKGIKDITEKEADDLATHLAPITDKKIIQKELGEWVKAKVKIPEKPIIPEKLEPLAQEARKYKSAEGFVKRIEPPGKKMEAPKISPVVSPENTIQKLINAIDEAIPLRGAQKKLYQKEMAKRTARVAAIGEKVGGEAGFYAQLGQLKGELPKKQFEAIKRKFDQKEIDLLYDTIEQSKNLLPLEKVSTKEGLSKLLEGIVPTKSELESLREVFPKELVDAVLARRPFFEKLAELGIELLNIPRTMMATTDLSFGFRQGVFMLGRPKQFFSAFKEQFKFFASEKAYQGLMESIKARPTYLKMKQAGLALTDISGALSKREEVFMGNLAERIPFFGRMVRASNRAYTGFANKLRADIFDDLLKKAEIAGIEITDDFLKSLGDFINAGTGRGKFGLKETSILPKSMERAAPVMNAVFFSPRLMASRLNLLNPYFYIQMNPFVRKEALKTLFADAGIFASVYGLWKLNGGDIGLDPKSADFGKLKIGNTRYDILGGFQQYIRLAFQLLSGEIVSSTTGRTITLGEGYKPLTREEILLRFFENKTSPIASFIIGLLKGQTATGEDIDVPTEIINRFIPMVVQDLYDISQEKGAEGLLMGLPAIFGVGMQTYGKQELVFGKNKLAEPTAQIRPVPELAEKIRELVMGQLPLGASKSFSVEAYFDQLNNLPRKEAADIFDKIVEANPELAKKLVDVVKEREKGITVKDKDLKSKGVASGDRALAIKKELDKLKTKEEKAALWEDYVRKGVITKEVARQLKKLLNQ